MRMESKEVTQILTQKWETIKHTIQEQTGITDISYNTWIDPVKFSEYRDQKVYIEVQKDNPISINYLNKNFYDFFKVIISETINIPVDIEFILEKEVNKSVETVDNTASAPISNEVSNSETSYNNTGYPQTPVNFESSNLNPKYNFETYVVGNNNKLAYSASLAVAESPGNTYNPLFLYGGPGLGKTHLIQSIGHFILEKNPNAKILYKTSDQFTNEVVESIRSGKSESMTLLRNRYRTVDVLIIDDIQFIIGKERTQEEFFNTFNELQMIGKQIVLSSDRPPAQMKELDERFRSRFSMGLIVDIQPPDYETRMAILNQYAEKNYRAPIDNEIFEYIANNIKSNVRELEGAFNKVIAYARLHELSLTLDNVKEALKDVILPDDSRVITPSTILNTVCEQYDITVDTIISRKRTADIVVPRQVAMYLCREMTDSSLDEIGKLLGGKDHATVSNGIDRITEKIKTDEDMARNVNIIRNKLNPQRQ